jgi:hypothetical protein
VNRNELEVPPPGAGVETEIAKVASARWLSAGTVASSDVVSINAVDTGLPSIRIVLAGVKYVPRTAITVGGSPTAAVSGDIENKFGDRLSTSNVIFAEAPPPGLGLETVIVWVCARARSTADRVI